MINIDFIVQMDLLLPNPFKHRVLRSYNSIIFINDEKLPLYKNLKIIFQVLRKSLLELDFLITNCAIHQKKYN
jgi:hypothetical protein